MAEPIPGGNDPVVFDAAKHIEFPEKDATEAQLGAVYARLGAISKAEDIADIAKEDPLFDSMKETFIGAKMTKAQVKTIYDTFIGNVNKQLETAKVENTTKYEALKKEWGDDFDTKIVTIKDGISKLGLDINTVKKLEVSIGSAEILKMFDTIFKASKDGDLKPGAQNKENIVPTDRTAAIEKLDSLMKDVSFANKIASGDVEATKLFNDLHKVIYSR